MTDRDGQPGGDPIGDLQRWLMRSGARGLTSDLTGQVRRALGQQPAGRRARAADVWETATTRPAPAQEAPECAWCPVCRAARRLRESREGAQGSPLAGAGDALASVVQEAYSAFEAVMRSPAHPHGRPAGPAGTAARPAAGGAAEDARTTADTGAAAGSWAAAADPWRDAGRAPDDRD